MKLDNNTANNFSSSLRPWNLGRTFAHFFHCEDNKNTQPLPYKLEMAKQEKYKINNYSHLNQCSTKKFVFSFWQPSHPKCTTKSFLAVFPIFPSSWVLWPGYLETIYFIHLFIHSFNFNFLWAIQLHYKRRQSLTLRSSPGRYVYLSLGNFTDIKIPQLSLLIWYNCHHSPHCEFFIQITVF